MKSIEDILKDRKATAQEALEIFDLLEMVPVDFMIGRWKGFEIDSNHQMDGLLAATGWYGKLFLNLEEVHPLLFYTKNLTELYSVNPRIVPMHMRMIEYRSRATATMCYDEKAILDHFAKIDENRVMGIMDLKGVAKPYIFILERDDDSDLKQNI